MPNWIRGHRRPKRHLDLPHLPVHDGGKMDKEEVHHFWRSLQEWANNLADELEEIASGTCPCVGFTATATTFSDSTSSISNGGSKVLNFTLDEVYGGSFDDSSSNSIDIDEDYWGVYDVTLFIRLTQSSGTVNITVTTRLYNVDASSLYFAEDGRPCLNGQNTAPNVAGVLDFTVDSATQSIGAQVSLSTGTRTLTIAEARLTAFKRCSCEPTNRNQGEG